MSAIPADDAEYQAMYDYETLVKAEVIKGDPDRVKAAAAWAVKEAEAEDVEKAAEDAVLKMLTE